MGKNTRDNITKWNNILGEISEKYFETIEKGNSYYEKITDGLNSIIEDIENVDNKIQDVILESGRKPIYKQKGIWIEKNDRITLTNDVINYFMAIYAKETILDREPSGSPDFITESKPYYLLDKVLVDLLLKVYDKSYIFSVSVSNKILRCILYSVTSTGIDDERFAISIRVQPKELPELTEINVPLEVKDIINMNAGLNLISGFSGNGKTWTMSALINYYNQNLTVKKVITTIEDPIEFMYKNVNAHIIQREVLKNTSSFKDASSDALRQGQDIVIFGELREKEEMYNALMLAESGKQVFATIHSNSITDTIERFVSEFESDKQQNIRERLLENLTMIIHQELIIYEKEQYPVVDMIFIKDDKSREEFKLKASKRTTLSNEVKKGNLPWITNTVDSYKELVKRGIITDNIKARKVFRAEI